MGRAKKSYQQRREEFSSRFIKKPSGCWIWNGPVAPDGYGLSGNGKFFRAHRASYILWKGEIPKGMWVLHKCDVPLCVNPDHLYVGSCRQNVKDALDRGLFPVGPNPKKGNPCERNGNHKLTEKEVKSLRAEYIPYKMGAHRLAKKYNISKRQVLRIIKGESWATI